MSYLRDCNRRQAAKVAALDPQPGQWAQLSDWFDDVWGRIEAVWPPANGSEGALSLWQGRGRAEHTFFYQIRTVSAELPPNARIIKDRTDVP